MTRPQPTAAARAALLTLGLLALLALALPWLAERGGSETSVEIATRLQSPATTIVLGSSVAQMGIAIELLPDSLSLAFPGTQPAHWLAIWRHHVLAEGHRPARLILYAPLSSLTNGQLVDESERSELVSLLPWSDPPLEELALGAPIGRLDRFHRLRRALRDGLLSAITEAPGWFGLAMPEQAPAGPNQPAQGLPHRVEMPKQMVPQSSLTATLIEEASAAGTRVTVVVPVVRGGMSDDRAQQYVLGWLLSEPVDLIDLSCLPIPDSEFYTPHHLRERGREQVTGLLAGLLGDLPQVPSDASGSYTQCPK